MIDLSVHIEADELVRGLGFAAAFAQATKRGGPAKSAPLDAVPCTAYLNWLLGFHRPRNARQRNRIVCIVARFCKFWSATYDDIGQELLRLLGVYGLALSEAKPRHDSGRARA